ncbi:MAG: hypothetical protein AAF978_05190, partial [Cyanobacteria bacterium P01_E01_bin.48]
QTVNPPTPLSKTPIGKAEAESRTIVTNSRVRVNRRGTKFAIAVANCLRAAQSDYRYAARAEFGEESEKLRFSVLPLSVV